MEGAAVDNDKARDHTYLEQGLLERKVRDLIAARGAWIGNYMDGT